MKYILFLIMMLFSNQAVAVDCSKQPTCEELNYSKEDNPKCDKNGYILCPYDQSYKKCVRYNCETLGFTQSDKSAWCKNIAACPNNKDYTACIKATCEIGDVYYSDGSCGLVEDYNGSKTPVGVVYYVSDGGYHGKVINLKNLTKISESSAFDPANPYYTKYCCLYWGYYGYDVQMLTNYNENNVVDRLKMYDSDLYNGKGNTDKILTTDKPYCTHAENTKEYYHYCFPQAAQAAHDFYPQEELKNDSKVGKGKWYLPALGELMDLFGYDNSQITVFNGTTGANGKNITVINKTLSTLKSKDVVAETLTDNYYWSSSEYSNNASWVLHMSTGSRGNTSTKNDGYYVRVSLQF